MFANLKYNFFAVKFYKKDKQLLTSAARDTHTFHGLSKTLAAESMATGQAMAVSKP